MKKNFQNNVYIEGILYDFKLDAKVSGVRSKSPNTPYIKGYLSIAVDNALTNIVRVYYTYVTPTFQSRDGNPPKPNSTYTFLKNVIDGKIATYMRDGIDKAAKVQIPRSNIAINEYYSNRRGPAELYSEPRYRGGFINICDALKADESQRNLFEIDAIITSCAPVDTDDGTPKARLKACIYDYNAQGASLYPMEFVVRNPQGIEYFESLDYPFFTKLYGSQESEIVTKKVEAAFGDPTFAVQDSTTRKEFVVKTATKNPYLWDDESTITVEEFNEMKRLRNEVYLPKLKQDMENAAAATAAANTTPDINVSSADNFDF